MAAATRNKAPAFIGLREARLAKGWSQERLERISGVQQTQISAIENGRPEKAGEKAWRSLSVALGVELKPGLELPDTWLEFLGGPFGIKLEDEVLAELVVAACRKRWHRAPVDTWYTLAGLVRKTLLL